jgi:hypothetical protein
MQLWRKGEELRQQEVNDGSACQNWRFHRRWRFFGGGWSMASFCVR